MFVTNWISTTKIQKISEITNFFRHYFLSRTEVIIKRLIFPVFLAILKSGRKKKYEPYVYSLINFTFVGSFTHFLLRAIFIVLPSFCWSS